MTIVQMPLETANLIMTGVPRAGTTLATSIVDGHADCVALNEPKWQGPWSREMDDPAEYAGRIFADFDRVRPMLLNGEPVSDKRLPGGEPATSYYRDLPGMPMPSHPTQHDFVRPGLTPSFLLAMKHNAHYSCILPLLVDRPGFSVLAIIRHPVPTILAWRSVDLFISRGELPAAEPFWPEIRKARESSANLLRTQCEILELFFTRYHELGEAIQIARYEDVAAGHTWLTAWLGRRYERPVPIIRRDWRLEHDTEEIRLVQRYVGKHCPVAQQFYDDLDGF